MLQSRQLAAIMFTDIVGYTTLMGEDEQRAFKLLKKNRAIQRPIVEKFHGRWLKEIGDGVLASFSTVSDAVYCAKEIQDTCRIDPDLNLRIGIHLGEVVFEENDVFGDGVNIASRLEPLAPVGGILVSESVYKNLINKKDIQSYFVGEKYLKNVKESVRVYQVQVEGVEQMDTVVSPNITHRVPVRFRNPGKIAFYAVGVLILLVPTYLIYSNFQSQRSPEEPTLGVTNKSIAVLPFTNMSNDPNQEYFSEGMMEEVLNHLVKIEDLQVTSRTSVMQYKGTTEKVSEIARQLGVSTILEGSVRKDGNRVRITVQLVDGKTDKNLWSETFDRSLDDIFAIQSEVAQLVANSLHAEIAPEVLARLESKPTSNLEAYNLWLEGIFIFSPTNSSKGMELWRKSIELDPEFAPGYASMGNGWLGMGAFAGSVTMTRTLVLQNALKNLQRALEIDPNYAATHESLGNLYLWYYWDFEKAEEEFNKLNELSPSSINGGVIDFLNAMGRFDEAILMSERRVASDLNNPAAWSITGMGYYLSGQINKGNLHYDTALKVFSENSDRWFLEVEASRAFVWVGRYEDAVEILTKMLQQNPNYKFPRVLASLAIAHYHLGELEEVTSILSQLEETSKESPVGSPSFYLAMVYAQMEESNKSFNWLQKAFTDSEVEMYWLKVEPTFEPLRNDPRWQEMLEKVGFSE